jgi:nitrogen fixation protein FixH
VVVAGIYTAWLAIKSNDGLVTDDYYKKGLAANQTIARNELAASLGLVAGVRIVGERMQVSLRSANSAFVMPMTLAVSISHPTRAGLDQTRVLTRDASGYSADFPPSRGRSLAGASGRRGQVVALDGQCGPSFEWRGHDRSSRPRCQGRARRHSQLISST